MKDGSSVARRRQARDKPEDARSPSSAVARAAAVLVVGTDDWGIQQAVDQLEAAGIRALTCHPTGESAFPCNALVEGRTCPLDVGFDVAVTVRARPDSSPATGEMGVVCALHVGVPLITAGIEGRNPFAPWARQTVGRGDDLAVVVTETLRDIDVPDIDLRAAVTFSGERA